ncbi:serine hydrolase [Streptomyces sp. NPDC047023]|uniref:D-alanyl-D-alanine carboxypeptidase family protein n=1 Tax=Streptomyces sp. NPDC047023 TaxID=3155139 RepID=UPI0034025758
MSALSWLVADADTGDVLAEHSMHRQLPPASTLKTLFGVTVRPRLDEAMEHTVTRSELDAVPAGSSTVGLVAGRTYSVQDLWRGVFLRSGNDAVHVLAGLNGGWKHTARQIEQRAAELGASDTRVLSPDGFDAAGQVSSAHDLAVFGRAGLANADLAVNFNARTALFPGAGSGDDREWYEISNTNRLLTGANGVTPYKGLVGVKNGYTSRAGNTLIAAARRSGRTILVAVMNPQSGRNNAVYEEARTLLDWGFGNVDDAEPVGRLPEPPPPTPLRTAPDHAK